MRPAQWLYSSRQAPAFQWRSLRRFQCVARADAEQLLPPLTRLATGAAEQIEHAASRFCRHRPEVGAHRRVCCYLHKRHAFATRNLARWVDAGNDATSLLPALSAYLGHSDLNSTLHYVHLLPERLRASAGVDWELLLDGFLLTLLYESGGRIGEVLALRAGDLRPTGSGEAEVHFFGKGNKHRATPLTASLWERYGEFERDKEGNWIDEIPDGNDHSIDAVRYAMLDDILRG